MPEWIAVIFVGIIGAAVHAFLTGGFVKPYSYTDTKGRAKYDPGIWGTLLVGAVAGFVAWGAPNATPTFTMHVEVHGVVTALIAGVGGSQFLRQYIDRAQLETSENNTAAALRLTAAAASQLRSSGNGDSDHTAGESGA